METLKSNWSHAEAAPPKQKAMQRYYIIACHVLWRELSYYAALAPHVFNFHFLPQGLHCTPDLLRQELQKAIDQVPKEYAAILIGYGLCSNGIHGIVARETPLVVPRAHDCITFLLGSKERYRQYFDEHPGTYWYTPGWIETNTQPGKERYEALLKYYGEVYGPENAEYLMQAEQGWFEKYSNAAYVDLGFGDNAPYRQYTRDCADWLKWNCDMLEGDAKLIQDLVKGDWAPEAFLVVEPGQTIEASHKEEYIVEANGCCGGGCAR